MPPLSSTIHLYDSTAGRRKAKCTYIIYFITGNPGLVEYYRTFFNHVYGLLRRKFHSQDVDFQIYGQSLAGFEVNGPINLRQQHGRDPPYDVNQQIEISEQALKNVVLTAKANGARDVRVILMGHSLGTYMCLEVIRRLREESKPLEDEGVRVTGAVLLFATVMHLARSPSGLKSSWLLRLPKFSFYASLFAKALTLLVPTFVLTTLIRLVMGFPADAARVTANFVKSRYGVLQALYMANDEMKEISIDKWDADVWGAAHPSTHPHPRPTLKFLFAKSDHWIANETRDELIKARGSNSNVDDAWKPKMEVDEVEGWPHGFCIKHSVPVAERTLGYIEDIVQKDQDT